MSSPRLHTDARPALAGDVTAVPHITAAARAERRLDAMATAEPRLTSTPHARDGGPG